MFSLPVHAGLLNNGATGYVTTALHFLFVCTPFRQLVSEYAEKGILLKAVASLFTAMEERAQMVPVDRTSNSTAITPASSRAIGGGGGTSPFAAAIAVNTLTLDELFDAMGWSEAETKTQLDVHEFLTMLFDALSSECPGFAVGMKRIFGVSVSRVIRRSHSAPTTTSGWIIPPSDDDEFDESLLQSGTIANETAGGDDGEGTGNLNLNRNNVGAPEEYSRSFQHELFLTLKIAELGSPVSPAIIPRRRSSDSTGGSSGDEESPGTASRSTATPLLTIEESLQSFNTVEQLEGSNQYVHPITHEYLDAEMCTFLTAPLPPSILIHVNRRCFDYQTMLVAKKHLRFEFGEELDFGAFVSKPNSNGRHEDVVEEMLAEALAGGPATSTTASSTPNGSGNSGPGTGSSSPSSGGMMLYDLQAVISHESPERGGGEGGGGGADGGVRERRGGADESEGGGDEREGGTFTAWVRYTEKQLAVMGSPTAIAPPGVVDSPGEAETAPPATMSSLWIQCKDDSVRLMRTEAPVESTGTGSVLPVGNSASPSMDNSSNNTASPSAPAPPPTSSRTSTAPPRSILEGLYGPSDPTAVMLMYVRR